MKSAIDIKIFFFTTASLFVNNKIYILFLFKETSSVCIFAR